MFICYKISKESVLLKSYFFPQFSLNRFYLQTCSTINQKNLAQPFFFLIVHEYFVAQFHWSIAKDLKLNLLRVQFAFDDVASFVAAYEYEYACICVNFQVTEDSCVKIISAHLKRIKVIIACDLWMESYLSGHHTLYKRRDPQKNYKLYAIRRNNQRLINWSSDFIDTCQKELADE